MMGLSTSGSISFGCAFVAGKKRVPRPAAGNTALRTFIGIRRSLGGGRWSLALRYSLFALRYSLFAIRSSLFAIRYSLFALQLSIVPCDDLSRRYVSSLRHVLIFSGTDF